MVDPHSFGSAISDRLLDHELPDTVGRHAQQALAVKASDHGLNSLTVFHIKHNVVIVRVRLRERPEDSNE